VFGGKEPCFVRATEAKEGGEIVVRLTTPETIRTLQRKLYRKAKQEPGYRFYALYDKVYRPDILAHAYRLVKAAGGCAGADGRDFEDIEGNEGVVEFLTELGDALRNKSYRAEAVLRRMIPKGKGGERPLGIPTIRDRVAQMAAKIVLEPIFEADFRDCSYGSRPKRTAHQAIDVIAEGMHQGYTQVIDADVSKGIIAFLRHAFMPTMACTKCPRPRDGRRKRTPCDEEHRKAVCGKIASTV